MTLTSPTLSADFRPLRFALRELRGGLHGFRIFVACIALGVMAIAGVGSFSRSLTDGLAREGRVILGGDLAFTLIHREADAAERSFLAAHGQVSTGATLRAMARTTDDRNALIELKAVDALYPLYGSVDLEPDMSLADALKRRDGAFGAAVDSTLLARLELNPGARLTIGGATIEITAIIKNEPDKLANGIAFGPRVIVSEDALRATGLLVPGSLVRWSYRLRLPDSSDRAAAAVTAAASTQLPDSGWQIRGRTNATPALERNVEHFTQFLTLVGLTALLVGGVGVANAVKSHIDRKRDVIATLKALGASGGRVFAIYLWQVLLLSAVGASIGLAFGAVLPFAIAAAFGPVIPLPIAPALQPVELMMAFFYGLLTALAFALWPLGRAHDVPVSALFRDAVSPGRRWPRRRYIVASALVVAALATIAVTLSYDRKIALIFIAAAAAVFVMLQLVAMGLMAVARRLPHARMTALRLAIANIHRPGALTPTIVLSLGLGLALLVTVIEIDGNLRRQFEGALPDKAPSFYFIDIQSADSDRFDAFVRRSAPQADLERVPMLRGRIMSANGIRADDIKAQPNASWVLQSDRGITFATEVPRGSTVVDGEWWAPDYKGPALVSFEKKIADGLNLKVGDPVVVNVLGRNIDARIANLRAVQWENLGINFVLVFSPSAFAGAPHTDIATLTYPGGGTVAQETALLKAVSDAFPAITTVRVKDAIEAVGNIVRNLVLAVRGASLVALVAAMLVLGGALAAGHSYRVYDAVVLKTLGATRGKLIGAYALEYLLLGGATALFGVAAGSVAAWLVVTRVMNLTYVWLPGPAAAAAFGALLVTVALGLVGTFTALGHKPATVLRNV
ncbi:MAG: putative transport system permease protein [Alphaproteobacteria bacterium]|nr:putative transport system permease protein [Alphaproteobacteria bacterium]